MTILVQHADGKATVEPPLGQPLTYLGGQEGIGSHLVSQRCIVISKGRSRIKVFFPDFHRTASIDGSALRIRDEPLVDPNTLDLPPKETVRTARGAAEAIANIPVTSVRDIGAYSLSSGWFRAASGDAENPLRHRAPAIPHEVAVEAIRNRFKIRTYGKAMELLNEAIGAGLVLAAKSDGNHLRTYLQPIPLGERTDDGYTMQWTRTGTKESVPYVRIDQYGFLDRRDGTPAKAGSRWVLLPADLRDFLEAEAKAEESRRAELSRKAKEGAAHAQSLFEDTLIALHTILEQAGIALEEETVRASARERADGTTVSLLELVLHETAPEGEAPPRITRFGRRLRELLDAEQELGEFKELREP